VQWIEALVAIAKALAWPVVVLVVVLLLRRDLGDLVRRLKRVTGPAGLSADFGAQAAATGELAKAVEPNPPNQLPAPQQEEPSREHLRAEAQRQPTGAIILAWSMVEAAARQLGYEPTQEPVELFVRRLVARGLVSPLTPSLAHRLQKLYDQAARGEAIPDPVAARDFVDAAWRLAATLRQAVSTEPGAWQTRQGVTAS